jgi:hypothetical protein
MKIKKNLLILLVDLVISLLGSFLTFTFAYGSSYGGMFIGGVITAGLTIVAMEFVEDYVD